MSTNKNLHNARNAKNDEFYTQLTDVAKELMHYKHHFKDKIVFCNCDNPTWSAFWKYFHLNFSALGLKKLISTHYDKTESTYKMEYTGGNDNDIEVGVKTPLEGNGDFCNQECLDLLDEADIVVTNPPFSLFREYVGVLMNHNKKFIIIGNMNAITYKEFFPLLRNNEVWLGCTNFNVGMYFFVPDDFEYRPTYKFLKEIDGRKVNRVAGCCWFTNLDHKKRHEKLILWGNYTVEEYPHYDNYDAINVDKVDKIPVDYDGVMGVPITFMDKYNPEQFKIIGLVNGKDYLAGIKTTKDYRKYAETKQDGTKTGYSGVKINGNPVLKGKPEKGNYFVLDDDVVHSKYARIFIRRKKDA